MPWLALTLYAVFVALTLGARTLAHWRRTGSTGVRGFGGAQSPLERVSGRLFAAAFVAAAVAPVGALVGVPSLAAWLDHAVIRQAGLTLYAVGLALTLWAQTVMGVSWRIGVDPAERTALVTGGPFVSVRNPVFTGMIAGLAGLGLLTPNGLGLSAAPLMWLAAELQVRWVEEPYLARTHGEAYAAYARRTGRFLPAVGQWR